MASTRTYADKPAIPEGQYRSVFGGFEKTKLAGFHHETGSGLDVTLPITRDMSRAARRARIRARKRAEQAAWSMEREIADALDELEHTL